MQNNVNCGRPESVILIKAKWHVQATERLNTSKGKVIRSAHKRKDAARTDKKQPLFVKVV